MNDSLAEPRLAGEMFGKMNGIVVTGKFGEANHVRILDSLAYGLAHAYRELLEIVGMNWSPLHYLPAVSSFNRY
jgi:hypothetical protein